MTAADARPRPVVGFIGLGDQGLPMAVAIAQAGYELHTWARRPGSRAALGETPYIGHDDLEGLAGASDVLAICVTTDHDPIGLLSGGLLDGLRRDAVVVNHGTGTQAMPLALPSWSSHEALPRLTLP